ncbi:MAG: hypothetical protein LBH18_03165 [Spirochaetaceae bacterium]|jgi:hypothetical protein|nr:hypothetical protein [Spirochaetaceae bacterium]
MKRVFLLVFALCLALNTAFTQTRGAIFAPFVSGLKADAFGKEVRLSWKDSESVRGPVYIYRSTRPYLKDGEADGQMGEVAYGTQAFTDNVPADGKWYYFVVASDQSLQKYDLPLPFNNTADVTVDSEKDKYGPVFPEEERITPEPYRYTYGTRPPGEITQPPVRGNITAINAVPIIGRGIEITFNAPNTSKNVALYRNVQPLRDFSDLLTSTVVAVNIRSPYMDYVTTGVPYYYAIVYEDDIKNGIGEILPGANATFIPAELPPAPQKVPAAPPPAPAAPSPAPNNNAGADYARSVPPSGDYSRAYANPYQHPNATNAPAYPYQTDETVILSEPMVFNRDTQISNDPDDYRLALIVQGPFMWGDWTAARDRLTEFIINAPNSGAADRARFYLAQCWYFIGDIRMALSTFLKLQQIYPEEAAVWIQSSLNKLAE